MFRKLLQQSMGGFLLTPKMGKTINMNRFNMLGGAFSKTCAFFSTFTKDNILYTQAQCYFRQQNYAKAMQKLQEANADISTDIPTLKLLAKTHVALSQFQCGLNVFQRIISLDPSDIESNVFSMGILEKNKENAEPELEKISKRITTLHEEKEGQKIALALISLLGEEYPQIANMIPDPSVFTSEEHRYLACAILKESFIRLHQYSSAIRILSEALDYCPEYVEEISFELAQLHHKIGHVMEETNFLEKSLAANENQFDILPDLAWIYYQRGNKLLALEYLAKAEELEPTNSKAYFYQAKILQQENKLEEATELLNKCLRLENDDTSAHIYNQLGTIAIMKHDIPLAFQHFFKALELDNQEVNYYLNIALTYKLSKANERALSYYEKALVLQPENLTALKEKTKLLISLNRTHEAIETYKTLLTITPNNADVLLDLAVAQEKVKDRESAAQTLKQLFIVDPLHAKATEFKQHTGL